MITEGIKSKLQTIQKEIKVNKNHTNDYGGYKYRSAEDIFNAFKVFEEKMNVTLVVSDEIVEIGGKVFVKSTATLYDIAEEEIDLFKGVMPNSGEISACGWAELAEHKGMSADQSTGACSSYARKYALNALFLLDDEKDADEISNATEGKKRSEEGKGSITQEQFGKIKAELIRTGTPESRVCSRYKVDRLEDLTSTQAESALNSLKKTRTENLS